MRLAPVWWPRLRKLRLSGIRVTSSGDAPTVLTNPEDVQGELLATWSPVYAHKPPDLERADRVLAMYKSSCIDQLGFASLGIPDTPAFVEIIKRAKHSQSGRDGIPYAGYQADPELSGDIIRGVAVTIADSDDNLLEQAPSPLLPPTSGQDDLGPEVPEAPTFVDFLQELNEVDVCFAPKGSEEEDKVAPTRTADKLRTIFRV